MEALQATIETCNTQIKAIDRQIDQLIAERYSVATRLQSVRGFGRPNHS